MELVTDEGLALESQVALESQTVALSDDLGLQGYVLTDSPQDPHVQ